MLVPALLAPRHALRADPHPPVEAVLRWTAPSRNEDGTPLTNLAGYNVHCGETSGNYPVVLDAGTATEFVVTGLERGRIYYFAVSAYNEDGIESTKSGEITWAHGDTDRDGLQDAWEAAVFGGMEVPLGEPEEDFDGDGVSNLEEFLAGTEATNAAHYGSVTVGMMDGRVTVLFTALAAEGPGCQGYGRYYDLEECTDGVAWTSVPGYTDIGGANQSVSWLPGTVTPLTFYRTKARLVLE